MSHILVIVYLAEVGLVLIVVPWTRFWDQNYFVDALPMLEALTNPVVRGSVSGFGLVSLGAALTEIFSVVRRRWLSGRGHAVGEVISRPVEVSPQELPEEVFPPSS